MIDQMTLPEIKQSSEHDKFKILAGNRVINKNHTQLLIKLFEAHPELIPLRPILVNKQFAVIDGQHRLEALRMLNIPVPYVMSPNLTIETAQILNASQRSWQTFDYIQSYTSLGNYNYQLLHDYQEKYKVSLTVLLPYLSENENANLHKQFRQGKFIASRLEEGTRNLEQLTDFADLLPFWRTSAFANALLKVMKIPSYDHERMLKGVEQHKPERRATRMAYLQDLEQSYNFGRSVNIERFY